MSADIEKLKDWHARLADLRNTLMELYADGAPAGLGMDTALAIGEAAGIISKAKAMIGRDIDDAEREP
jgi:hypothetical protein